MYSTVTPEVVRALVPADVAVGVRCVRGDDEDERLEAALHPAERRVLGARAVAGRRQQFALGRAAAAAALRGLGRGPEPVLRGPGGQPCWPAGVVGAISHSGPVGVAVVGPAARYRGLGVDVERTERGFSAAAARLVCLPGEAAWTEAQPTEPDGVDTAERRRVLLFSAKEAIFKALYPVEEIWLGYGDAELRWVASDRSFVATLRKAAGQAFPAGFTFPVRCWLGRAEVLSATWV